MALRTRPTQFPELGSGVATEQLTAASRLVSYLTGFAIQPNKAIVGGNAFAHESGIHQDGVIKNPLTYEIMTPQSVGLSGSQLTIGKLSGRRGPPGQAPRARLRARGRGARRDLPPGGRPRRRQEGGHRRGPPRARRAALVRGPGVGRDRRLERDLVARRQRDGLGRRSTSAARTGTAETTGNGPVNALFGAVDEALQPVLGWHPVLTEYEIKAVSAGEDAQGQVLVRCRRSSDEGPGALVVTGHGLSTNIIEASLEAYLVAVNKLHGAEINGVSVAFVAPRQRRVAAMSRTRPATRALPRRDHPRRRRRAGGRRRRATRRRRGRRRASASRVDWSRAPRRRRRHRRATGSPSATRTSPPAARPTRSCSVRSAARSGPTRARRSGPSRRSSPCAAVSGCTPTSARCSVHPALAGSSPLRPELLDGVDMLIVRELTGGIYFGDRTEASGEPGARTGARHAALRRARDPARSSGWRSSWPGRGAAASPQVDKANVLATSRLWRRIADEIAAEYPDVRLDHQLVDSCAMLLVRRPADFDVIVTENLFGDILSDEAAVLAGSLGVLPSASLGERRTDARHSSGCTSRSTAPRRTSPAATSRTRSARSCPRRCCCGPRSGATMRPTRSRRPSRRALDDGWRTADLADPADPADGLVVVGTTGFATAVVEALEPAPGVAGMTGPVRTPIADARSSSTTRRCATARRARTSPCRWPTSCASRGCSTSSGCPSSRAAGRAPTPRTSSSSPPPGRCAGNGPSWPRSGSTRHRSNKPEDDPNLRELVAAETPVVTIFGKSWLLHVIEVLGATPDENLDMIADSVGFVVDRGREAVYDAEHFFDGYKADRDYALATLRAARQAGARTLVLCDTNGGTLTDELVTIIGDVRASLEARPRRAGLSPGASTPTTTPSSRWPTRWPPWRPGSATSRPRSTAMASGPATRTWSASWPTSRSRRPTSSSRPAAATCRA